MTIPSATTSRNAAAPHSVSLPTASNSQPYWPGFLSVAHLIYRSQPFTLALLTNSETAEFAQMWRSGLES